MPKVMSLGHVGLYVRDIERSKAFYRDILGLQISDENPKTGSTFMTAKGRLEEHHELLLVPGREDGKVVQQISFRCASLADVKEFYRLFLEHNIPIIRTVSQKIKIGSRAVSKTTARFQASSRLPSPRPQMAQLISPARKSFIFPLWG